MPAFTDALRRATVPVVMELKRRSADGHDLFAGRTPAQLVARYEALGAPCLSVVTGRWFGGDDALLRAVAARTDRPILKKDFITSERQIATAAEQGAAAVLLTAELLPGRSVGRLAAACHGLGVTPFVEIANAAQLARLDDAGGCVVAVNNKDIRRRERGPACLQRSLELLPAIRARGAACAVSAGGIGDARSAALLLDAGYDALLVGTALLASERFA